MTWKKKLQLINSYLQMSNLSRLNIITDNNGYLVRNDILKKNLQMAFDLVDKKILEQIKDTFFQMDNKQGDNFSLRFNKNIKEFIISSLLRDLPTRI